MSKKKAPYGTWDSPINTDTVVGKDNIVFDDVLVDPITHTIYHLEESPGDGRCIIVQTQTKKEVLPTQYSARTKVQEYGGAPAIVYGETIYFSNAYDNRIYAFKVGATEAKAVTPDEDLFRYANFAIHPQKTNLLITLREDHKDDPHGTNPRGVINTICVVDTQAAAPNVKVIIYGADFYATPVFNPTGNKIGWQEWDLPDMPWQGGLIYVADVSVDSGSLEVASKQKVAGEAKKESATFPSWIDDTTLAYITDGYNKFWNPYLFHTDTKESTPVLKNPLKQDFAEPAWYLGLYPYAVLGDRKYGVFTAFKAGGNILYIVNLTAPSEPVLISWDFTVAQHIRAATEDTFVFTGSKSSAPGGVVRGTVTVDQSGSSYTVDFEVLKYSADPTSSLLQYTSQPQPKDVPAPSDGHLIHVVRYDPYNPDYSGPIDPNEKPPCIVGVHGGPTGLESQALNWIKMFFTSRGFAWVDVNYRGSSGYGREYMDLLYGNWGRYDVDDCKEAAAALAAEGHIDEKRVAIRGGSAGAYTTLASLTFAPKAIRTFYTSACGAYGCVADVENLSKVSEKFEVDYIPTLFGGPGPWDDWNPIKHATNIEKPLLVLQGLEDGVVHPDMLRDFLSQSTHAGPSGEFAFYPNEGHHWHLEYTIKNALSREYHWYLDTLLQPVSL